MKVIFSFSLPPHHSKYVSNHSCQQVTKTMVSETMNNGNEDKGRQ